jgi:hypothetical protein
MSSAASTNRFSEEVIANVLTDLGRALADFYLTWNLVSPLMT